MKSQSSKIAYRSTVVRFGEFCSSGKRHQLFASWGMMKNWYECPQSVQSMAIAYYGKKPIGAAILMKRGWGAPRFGVYVKRNMRRKGVGRKLTMLVKSRSGQGFTVDKDKPHQRAFFDTMGFRQYPY